MTGAFLDNLLLFTRELRAAGIPVGQDQVLDAVRALELIDIAERTQVFFALRTLLITRAEHLALFAALFEQFFTRARFAEARTQTMPRAPRHVAPERPFDITTYMAYKARLFDEEIDVGDKSQTFSAAEALQRKDFSLLTPEELVTLRGLINRIDWRISKRESRRKTPHKLGRAIDMRRVLRSAARTGGFPSSLFWQARKIKPRPIVLIADISGSMEKYARVLLMFFHCVSRQLANVSSFVFGTRLSNITAALRLRNIDVALGQAGRDVVDWAGGTRIGECLRVFNRRWARRVLRRGALCVIVSDGWDRGEANVLSREMRYLQHRCHRLIWLNPLLGARDYAARVVGMRAALPYIDDFLPVHNLESLRALNDRLSKLR
jgi:hypothetical protein